MMKITANRCNANLSGYIIMRSIKEALSELREVQTQREFKYVADGKPQS